MSYLILRHRSTAFSTFIRNSRILHSIFQSFHNESKSRILNSKKKLAYCPIYKAASTSMLQWLLKMQGVSPQDIRKSGRQISDIARRFYPSIDYPHADRVGHTIIITTVVFKVGRYSAPECRSIFLRSECTLSISVLIFHSQ